MRLGSSTSFAGLFASKCLECGVIIRQMSNGMDQSQQSSLLQKHRSTLCHHPGAQAARARYQRVVVMQHATYDENSYRMRKEASVSDLTGTTMMELVLVSTPIPMSVWLLMEVKVRCPFDYSVFVVCTKSEQWGSQTGREALDKICKYPTYVQRICKPTVRQALGGRHGHLNAAWALGWRGFTLEVLVVLLPSLAAMVWPACALTLLLSMAFASEAYMRYGVSRQVCEPHQPIPQYIVFCSSTVAPVD